MRSSASEIESAIKRSNSGACFGLGILLLVSLCSCNHLRYAAIQKSYARIQNSDPSQLNLKHMIDHQSYYVVGGTSDPGNRYESVDLAVVAYSDRFQEHERVDTMYFATVDTHFGLNVPEGDYDLLAVADVDRDGRFESSEVIGRQRVSLNPESAPQKVLSHLPLELGNAETVDWVEEFPVPAKPAVRKSLYYPGNSIRSLEDPIFDPGMATLGMYDPAAFLETAPILFYALEEDLAFTIPVIFVHGIGGTPRSFEPLLAELDRTRYRPWFFYYPSGGDLNQLAELFYRIFLSGKTVSPIKQPFIVVAHSMGGLVVREALNLYGGDEKENKVGLFISIATPFNGHAASAIGEQRGLIVLPAWRDLNPGNEFIKRLFRKPLPEFTRHHLVYAFHNDGLVKLGENSDGVVTLSSQLRLEAQEAATGQFGINNSHTGVLLDPALLENFREQLKTFPNRFPEDHLAILDQGGFPVPEDEEYDPLFRYMIETYGRYLVAMAQRRLEPIDSEQERFIKVSAGELAPSNKAERAWLRYYAAHRDHLD